MSVRVSMSRLVISACSGLIYAGVPMNSSKAVKNVLSVSGPAVALAIPKSIIFGTGTPSLTVTRMLEGLISRWMTPFWCACWMAWHTWVNNLSRSAVGTLFSSQNSVILMPRTSSMTK